ncbi:putative peptidase [Aspergillus clavatus NRRL 1]|uniref:Probable carboxypeptidase ACLA_088580 n=1 Tax=Aspergillus clavatus (strain ATCC 1007 / CBS 513.65 / DSM 816 / NCTC 3887 / NRRL 1 / QM 1276 / 107) TaxID=344612 RepID=P20D1_ASPCL|nr:peptidase, putative [Aspergillus clavatus NRRL 1]A1CE70.1 RecName: Full=Probable carboxypeptidase ACLA_088580; AltName: Full=Peptidase M20 domain-containing protein ACLA_088580; Flags: Precursor [Aspergillus clavatus NRRL 1]EAW11169.1 peptidase, putative [Aspergillus clavatus NRRL 1]
MRSLTLLLSLSTALRSVAAPHPASPQGQIPLGGIPSASTSEVGIGIGIGIEEDPFPPAAGSGHNDLEDVINASPLLSFHRDLVSIESISGHEARAAAFVADFLEAHNFTVVKQPVAGDRVNIFASPRAHAHSRPEILLTSHLDTVPPFIPYSLHRNDSRPTDRQLIRIAGRGAVDAKASVAAQIFAALDILHADPSAPLGLLFVVGEEVGGDGMKAFSHDPRLNPAPSRFHTVIFGEPTDFALVAGHKGMLGFEVLASGRPAHSGYPWLGRSAVSAILPALRRVDALGHIPVHHGGLPASHKYGRTTLNIGVLEGGVATNVVPAAARADVAVRLAAGSVDDARAIIAAAVADATHRDPAVVVDFSRHLEAYPPQDLDVDVPGFEITTVNYGTDVPNLHLHPRPDGPVKRYLYGPGSIFVAHGENEGLTVGALEEAVGGYKKLVQAALERTRA